MNSSYDDINICAAVLVVLYLIVVVVFLCSLGNCCVKYVEIMKVSISNSICCSGC